MTVSFSVLPYFLLREADGYREGPFSHSSASRRRRHYSCREEYRKAAKTGEGKRRETLPPLDYPFSQGRRGAREEEEEKPSRSPFLHVSSSSHPEMLRHGI